MTVSYGATRELDVAAVIQGTAKAIGKNLGVFLLLAVVFAGLPSLAVNLFRSLAPGFSTPGGSSFDWIWAFFLTSITGAVLQGALTRATLQHLNGEHVSFGAALATGLRFLPALFLLSVMMTVAYFIGFLLFVFPGLMMVSAWAAASPALVTENRRPFEAFGRSAQLTRDNRWRVFGLVVIYTLLSWGFGLLIAGVLSAFGAATADGAGPYIAAGSRAIVTTVQAMVAAAGAAVLYFELRRIREGVSPETLASVFD